MHKIWDKLFKRGEFTELDVDEEVAGFAELLRERNARRVLDLGCGAGRHILHLSKLGFEVHGLDFSAEALRICWRRLLERALSAHLVLGDMRELGYVSGCFDGVVCWYALYHDTLSGIRRTLSEVWRVLRSGGLLLVNFMSKRTWKYGRGEEVEEDTFIQDEGSEAGMLHHYSSREEVRELLGEFRVLHLELREHSWCGKLSSRWVALAEKP